MAVISNGGSRNLLWNSISMASVSNINLTANITNMYVNGTTNNMYATPTREAVARHNSAQRDNNILWMRRDSKGRNNQYRRYVKRYIGEVMQKEIVGRFEHLYTRYPSTARSTFSASRMHPVPSYISMMPSPIERVVLSIRGVESLILGKVRHSTAMYEEGSIFLLQILPSTSRDIEKLKRLLLRHIGFNCTSYAGKLKIELSNEVILIPFGQGLEFNPTKLRIGVCKR